jgi:hypothetical protein
MAASLTGTLGKPLGHGTPGGQIAVAMFGRPSLSRPVTPRQRPGTSAARHFSPAGAGCGGRKAHHDHPSAYRGGRPGCRADTSLWPRPLAGQASERTKS